MKHIVITGSGIKSISHMTHEVIVNIGKAQQVLFLANEPLLKEYLISLNSSHYDLGEIYVNYEQRQDAYIAITDKIIASAELFDFVCVVFYGHPFLCADSTVRAAYIARGRGIEVSVLPAVSALDCLVADLSFDPISNGSQNYEATDFLLRNIVFDPRSYLILWQISFIGINGHSSAKNIHGLRVLTQRLLAKYSADHEVIIHEAAIYPHVAPRVEKLPLRDLSKANVNHISTLCIPPTLEPSSELLDTCLRSAFSSIT